MWLHISYAKKCIIILISGKKPLWLEMYCIVLSLAVIQAVLLVWILTLCECVSPYIVRMNGSGGSPGLVRRRIQEMQQTQLQAAAASSTSSSTSHSSQSRISYTSHDRSTSRSPSRFLTSNQRSVSIRNFLFQLRDLYGFTRGPWTATPPALIKAEVR